MPRNLGPKLAHLYQLNSWDLLDPDRRSTTLPPPQPVLN